MSALLNFDLTIDENADFAQAFTWTRAGVPVDLTSFTAQAMVRRVVGDASPLLTLTNTSGIALGGTTGVFLLSTTATQNNALLLLLPGLIAQWDILLIDSTGAKTKGVSGRWIMNRTVTR